jgi:hypothetical protein
MLFPAFTLARPLSKLKKKATPGQTRANASTGNSAKGEARYLCKHESAKQTR